MIPLTEEDSKLAREFTEYQLITEKILELVFRYLPDIGSPREFKDLKNELNFSRNALVKRLKLLTSQGAIEQSGGHWFRLHDDWEFEKEEHQEMIEHRHYQVDAMLSYSATEQCLSTYIQPFLGDKQERQPCGECSNCTGEVPDLFKSDF